MKKILCIAALCPFASAPLQAQDLADSLSYPHYADSVLDDLDANLIHFGTSYEGLQPEVT